MNVACDYEAPMQMLTTEKYIAAWPVANHPRWSKMIVAITWFDRV